MNTIKKVLITIISLITCFCLYLLYVQRVNMKNNLFEGMSGYDENEQGYGSLKSLYDGDISINSYNNDNDMELKHFCIKGSYSTAYQGINNGNVVSLNMTKYVISRGCRFLDFEIFADPDNNPVIGFSNRHDNTFNEAENTISLSKVLNTIDDLAFYSAPNTHDPIFVHLRIKTGTNINNKIGQIIKQSCNKRLFKGTVYNTIKLSELSKKIIIAVDKSIAPNYFDTELSKYINIETSTNNFKLFREMKLKETNKTIVNIDTNNSLKTDVLRYTIVMPDYSYGIINSNPDMKSLIQDYSVQIICYSYYNDNENLKIYEDFYNSYRSAIVPLSKAITYDFQ